MSCAPALSRGQVYGVAPMVRVWRSLARASTSAGSLGRFSGFSSRGPKMARFHRQLSLWMDLPERKVPIRQAHLTFVFGKHLY